MNKFRIYTINFKDWKDYEDKVNALYKNGEIIDETLVQYDFAPLSTSQHIVRLKRCDK